MLCSILVGGSFFEVYHFLVTQPDEVITATPQVNLTFASFDNPSSSLSSPSGPGDLSWSPRGVFGRRRARGFPKRPAPSGVAPRQWLPIRPIIVRIGIWVGVGIGIGIDTCSDWRLALMDRSNFAAKVFQHCNNAGA